MIDAPRMLMLGSTGRESGRTDFACALIEKLSADIPGAGRRDAGRRDAGRQIVAIKVTAVKEAELECSRECEGCGVCTNLTEDYAYTLERDQGRGKDTERLAAAGADQVYWLRVRGEEHLERGIAKLLGEIDPRAYVICESNILRSVVNPGLFLLFRAREERAAKPSSSAIRAQADRVVEHADGKHDLDVADVDIAAGTWALRLDAAAIILAGGRSSRMQTDKSMLPIAGVPMIEHIHRQLRRHFRETLISANDVERYAFVGAPVIPDGVPDQGPLMGIASALEASAQELNFVTACDMPEVDMRLVRRMLREARDHEAVVPRTGDMIEPLFAIYRKSAARAFQKTLNRGNRRIRDAFESLEVNYFDISALTPLENLNTRDEYDGYIARIDP